MFFTKENQLIIIFVIFTVIVGSGVAIVKYLYPGVFMGNPDHIAGSDREDDVVEMTERSNLVKGKQIIPQKSLTTDLETSPSSSSDNDLIDLNGATIEQLQQLPRIGPVMAKRIIEYRKRHRRFISIEQIMEVRGIGEKTFEKLKDKIVVSSP